MIAIVEASRAYVASLRQPMADGLQEITLDKLMEAVEGEP